MNWPDIITSLLYLSGASVKGLSIRKAITNRSAKGVHWLHPGFGVLKGLWFFYFYYSLEQFASMTSILVPTVLSLAYAILLIRWRKQ